MRDAGIRAAEARNLAEAVSDMTNAQKVRATPLTDPAAHKVAAQAHSHAAEMCELAHAAHPDDGWDREAADSRAEAKYHRDLADGTAKPAE